MSQTLLSEGEKEVALVPMSPCKVASHVATKVGKGSYVIELAALEIREADPKSPNSGPAGFGN